MLSVDDLDYTVTTQKKIEKSFSDNRVMGAGQNIQTKTR